MKKKVNVKEKILNHLVKKGKKPVSEKIFKKSIKEIQKTSKKQTKVIVTSALALTAPVLKTLLFRKKQRKKTIIKEVPVYLREQESRTSEAIKVLVSIIQTKSGSAFNNLKNEFIETVATNSDATESAKTSQNYAWTKNQHLTEHYKWW